MPRTAVAFTGPRSAALVEEEELPPQEGEVRVRTLYSGISAGTEMSMYRNTNPYMHKYWDAGSRLFLDGTANEPVRYPVVAGYEEVGEVVEAGPGVDDLPPGTLVYGTWGHRSEQNVEAAHIRDRLLPAGADPLIGIFSHIGATALNGILDSGIHVGETVAVFGLGVVGQLVAQLAALSGADVIGVDLIPARLQLAQRLGAAHVINGSEVSAAEEIKRLTGGRERGRGADVCIEASGSTQALNEAVRACAHASKVVALGFYQGEAKGLYLGEEFHHNRINIVCSQIGGVASELQHRWNRIRLVQTFIGLAARGRLQLRPLITHIAPPEQSPELFRLMDENPAEVVQAVIDFGGAAVHAA
jgi:2-desacetyl-2-hydroxyethyl bacteriochlorophyllide A dehydrogenase